MTHAIPATKKKNAVTPAAGSSRQVRESDRAPRTPSWHSHRGAINQPSTTAAKLTVARTPPPSQLDRPTGSVAKTEGGPKKPTSKMGSPNRTSQAASRRAKGFKGSWVVVQL